MLLFRKDKNTLKLKLKYNLLYLVKLIYWFYIINFFMDIIKLLLTDVIIIN